MLLMVPVFAQVIPRLIIVVEVIGLGVDWVMDWVLIKLFSLAPNCSVHVSHLALGLDKFSL